MKQMTAPKDVSVLTKRPFGQIAAGFFRYFGNIYYACSRWEGPTFSFPVREDGTISKSGGASIFPNEFVDVIHPKDLGITKLAWA